VSLSPGKRLARASPDERRRLLAPVIVEIAPRLFRYGMYLTWRRDHAEDLVQRAVLEFLEGYRGYDGPAEPDPVLWHLKGRMRSLNDKRSSYRRVDRRLDTTGHTAERNPDARRDRDRLELVAPASERPEALVHEKRKIDFRARVIERLREEVRDDPKLSALLEMQMAGELPVAEKARRLGVDEAGYIALNKKLVRRAERIAEELEDERR
jgi:hypothetical protein